MTTHPLFQEGILIQEDILLMTPDSRCPDVGGTSKPDLYGKLD